MHSSQSDHTHTQPAAAAAAVLFRSVCLCVWVCLYLCLWLSPCVYYFANSECLLCMSLSISLCWQNIYIIGETFNVFDVGYAQKSYHSHSRSNILQTKRQRQMVKHRWLCVSVNSTELQQHGLEHQTAAVALVILTSAVGENWTKHWKWVATS